MYWTDTNKYDVNTNQTVTQREGTQTIQLIINNTTVLTLARQQIVASAENGLPFRQQLGAGQRDI